MNDIKQRERENAIDYFLDKKVLLQRESQGVEREIAWRTREINSLRSQLLAIQRDQKNVDNQLIEAGLIL